MMQRSTLLTFILLLTISIFLLLPNMAQAAQCTVTANPIAFGNYNPFTPTPRNRTGRITAVCKGNGTLTVALSTGQSGTYDPRYMTSGTTSDQLDYNLYTTAARVTIFGDGSAGTQTVSKNFKNNSVLIRVYGQIPAMENIASGSYADNIVATITF
jgi:spore coat protein U domain-containing protein, fimbrial subunit CupE1/2/3/6